MAGSARAVGLVAPKSARTETLAAAPAARCRRAQSLQSFWGGMLPRHCRLRIKFLGNPNLIGKPNLGHAMRGLFTAVGPELPLGPGRLLPGANWAARHKCDLLEVPLTDSNREPGCLRCC